MKILYVVNDASFFLSHRLPIGLKALELGHDVAIVTAPNTGEQGLAQFGFRHIPIEMSRSGFNVWQEIMTFRRLTALFRREVPDLVHHVTIKPVIYGSFAAKTCSVRAVVNAVPGMGFVFSRRGMFAAVARTVINLLYRWAFSHPNMRVIFQNTEDMHAFLGHAIVRRDQAVLIRGSGVDLNQFDPTPLNIEPQNKPASQDDHAPLVFLMVARMLKDKGVNEFARAAASVATVHPDWQFLLAGGEDPGNPTSLSKAQLQGLEAEYGIRWLGQVENIPALMASAHVICLPTYYREGLPKVLLEASAAGRAMIASDIAGCREVVTPGVTGLLVPPRAIRPLVKAMLTLGEDAQLRDRFGAAARKKAEAIFSVDDVVEHTFRVYAELLTE